MEETHKNTSWGILEKDPGEFSEELLEESPKVRLEESQVELLGETHREHMDKAQK